MPYYHKKDNGKIHFWRRRCAICGKRWPFSSYFKLSLPEDMIWAPMGEIKITKGETSYAKWADRIPLASIIASRLPNWPRWLRISVSLLSIIIVILVIYILVWGF